MSSSNKIVVFGSINKDFFNYVERFPKPGESICGNFFEINNGGKGANQAVTAAKLGANVQMIGMVGDDMFSESAIQNLKESGVKTDLIQKLPNINTGCAVITVDAHGENNIIVTPGANDKLSVERAQELEDHISKATLLLCQAEVPQDANLKALQLAKKHGVKTFLNPAPANPDLDLQLLKYTDILCTNETETQLITKSKNLNSIEDYKEAAKKLIELGPKTVIITLGKNGALVVEKKGDNDVQAEKVEAPKTEAIDSTGAGDCFNGSFAYFLTNHSDMSYAEIAKKSAQIAAISVSRKGCQSSYPSINEVKQKGIL